MYATNRLRSSGVFGDQSDSFMISDCPRSFMDPFWNEGLYRSTSIAKWVMQNRGNVSLRYGADLYHAGQLSQSEAESQARLMEAGVTSGYAIGYNSRKSTVITGFGLINFGKSGGALVQ